MTARKEALESKGDSNDATQAMEVTAQVSSSAATPTPSHFGSSFASLPSTQQYPFVDPNVVMMTNAAATIAAVAASAVQQMAKGRSSPNPSSNSAAGGAPSQVASGLVAALQGSRKPLLPAQTPHVAPNATLPHHMAALLGATQGGQHSMPFQTPVAANAASQLHNSLSPGDAASSLHPAAAHAAAAIQSGVMSNTLLPQMHSWNLEQLEKHVSLLQQLGQQVPHSVALLLADAKRKEKKKTAKRVANRKSASTSRARKKALVEEMTRTNARLKRQALILALLPDLVIAITTDGEITFCSAQVERVLQHQIDDLIGAKLQSLIAPNSRDTLQKLIEELVGSNGSRDSGSGSQEAEVRHGTKRRLSNQRASETAESKAEGGTGNGNSNVSGSSQGGGHSGLDTSAAAIVSEQSFPLSVVEVESKQSARPTTSPSPPTVAEGSAERAEPNENSDTSTSHGEKQQMSSLTNSSSRSPTASSSGEDDGARGGGSRDSAQAAGSNGKRVPSSDDSSLSSESKNMRNANEKLDRNVRLHNQRMLKDSKKNKADDGPKDDVTGASVTANNATARLSSLKHVPEASKTKEDIGDQSSSDDSLLGGVEEKKKGESANASDDSGYRESNDSREETSSSGSDTSNSNDRRKEPLAATRRMCLIRQDLTTVWCEVTSSIRTKSADEGSPDSQPSTSKSTGSNSDATPMQEGKELLLCLRPIRDGEKKVDEALRFVPLTSVSAERSMPSPGPEGMVSSSSGDADQVQKSSSERDTSGSGSNSNSATSSNKSQEKSKRPPKKRPLGSKADEEADQSKRKRAEDHADDHEKSVVESLMLMNKSQ